MALNFVLRGPRKMTMRIASVRYSRTPRWTVSRVMGILLIGLGVLVLAFLGTIIFIILFLQWGGTFVGVG